MMKIPSFSLFVFILADCQFRLAAQTVKVSIDPQITCQYIEGFGACVMDFTNPPFFSDPKLYDLAVNDLGMNMLCLSFPQELKEVNDDDDPDHLNWQAFHMHYLKRGMKIALKFKKRGVDRFMFSIWSPSRFIKTNCSTVQGDDMIYEIQNEPWSDQAAARHKSSAWKKPALDNWSSHIESASDASLKWQGHMIDLIVETEKLIKNKHLIAQDYCNTLYAIPNIHPTVSILDFHYAWPEAVACNYGWNKAIGFDKSGLGGSECDARYQQTWIFATSGGGLFTNLDYPSAVGYEDGTLIQKAPGGGSPTLRKQ